MCGFVEVRGLTDVGAQVENNEEKVRAAKLQEALYKHYASSGVPKGLHCLALKLTGEYSSNARARQDLPSPDLAPRLTDNTLHHLVVATDNVLAAAVVVRSTIENAAEPEKVVFHVITDKKTHAAMHAWFALNPLAPAIVEVKGVHQFEWLTRDNVPVLEAMESSQDIKYYYHGDHAAGTNISQYSPTILAAYLQARSPKYISIMNHLRIYLPDVSRSPEVLLTWSRVVLRALVVALVPGTAKPSVTDLFMGLAFSSYRREPGVESWDESLLVDGDGEPWIVHTSSALMSTELACTCGCSLCLLKWHCAVRPVRCCS